MDDIYNFDETGLLYRQLPRRTLARGTQHGFKLAKDRVTVALCVNASGTDKVEPFVIGFSKRPRCFGKAWHPNNIRVRYEHNKSSWMTASFFQDWLKWFDRRMHGRRVWLLLDNASCHELPKCAHVTTWTGGIKGAVMNNVNIAFLPANTTSHIQPLDGGIIRAFKAHYRRDHVRWHLAQLDEIDESLREEKVNLRQAITWISKAWKTNISEQVVQNCWRASGLLPMSMSADIRNCDERQIDHTARANAPQRDEELASLLERLKVRENGTLEPVFDAEEMLNLEAEDVQAPAQASEPYAPACPSINLIDFGGPTQTLDCDDDDDSELVGDGQNKPAISLLQAQRAARTLHDFCSENLGVLGAHEHTMYLLHRTLLSMVECAATRQAMVTDFFSPLQFDHPSSSACDAALEAVGAESG